MLIERGANVSAVENTWKMTPLHYLASYASTQRSHGHWTDDDYLSNFQFRFSVFYRKTAKFYFTSTAVKVLIKQNYFAII